MNLATIPAQEGLTAATLHSQSLNTGLSLRGELIWLIHQVEFFVYPYPSLSNTQWNLQVCLSTQSGLSSFPDADQRGVIASHYYTHLYPSSGNQWWVDEDPFIHSYLPPIPLASSMVIMYVYSNMTVASTNVWTRIGYTTVPLTSATYLEIAEAWGW